MSLFHCVDPSESSSTALLPATAMTDPLFPVTIWPANKFEVGKLGPVYELTYLAKQSI